MFNKTLLKFVLILVSFLFILQSTQAQNQPSGCTATITLDNDPSTVVIGGYVQLTVTSSNAPTILTSYDVYLYQNGVLVQNVTDVEFEILGLGPFSYTFDDVEITNQTTQFYAVIIRNFVIFPLVYIQSNQINVTARVFTNSTIDRSQPTGNPNSGLIGSAFTPYLAVKLQVVPQVPSGQSTSLTTESISCNTSINGVYEVTTNSGNLARDSYDLDFGNTCQLPSLTDSGDSVVIVITFPGDSNYAPSTATVSFTTNTAYQYANSDVLVTYPANTRSLIISKKNKNKTTTKKIKKVKKAKKNKRELKKRSFF